MELYLHKEEAKYLISCFARSWEGGLRAVGGSVHKIDRLWAAGREFWDIYIRAYNWVTAFII